MDSKVNDHVSLQWPSYEQPHGSNLKPQREQISWFQVFITSHYLDGYVFFFLEETTDCMIMPRVERINEMAGRKEAGSVILANNHVN